MIMAGPGQNMNMNIVTPAIGRKIRQMRSYFGLPDDNLKNCASASLYNQLRKCVQRLQCKDPLLRMERMYRTFLVNELRSIDHLVDPAWLNSEYDGEHCQRKMLEVCPKQLFGKI
ncbi:uncharacterized protein LOC111709868 [Eurytemora carolleeae]|uniref:uncharacterized protein LOC111709868 n=1 Tax=Eurytemora carolleeae TaxID=1294199 RepID=UPI000C7741F3|nr:uncharacterized protein LOC111709868 [Eurytemora carolleeae]|eukprot:XP_023339565.1 uncharacterized protein LOC111709868 [Eurytemora affinis]